MVATPAYRVGDEVWVPCEVREGPFPNEKRVYIKMAGAEWFGFVGEQNIRAAGPGFSVRATVIHIGHDSIVLKISGQSPTNRALKTNVRDIPQYVPVAP